MKCCSVVKQRPFLCPEMESPEGDTPLPDETASLRAMRRRPMYRQEEEIEQMETNDVENRLSMPEERVSSPDSSYRSSLSSRSPSRTSPVSFYFFLIIKSCLINDPIENLISAYSILKNKKRNHF